MLLRCCIATLLLLVIGCAQCLNDLSHDCLKSVCEFHSDQDGEKYITRPKFKTVGDYEDDGEFLLAFTSETVNAEGTVVSRVNVTFGYLREIFKHYWNARQRGLSWTTKSPFVEDFWLGDFQDNGVIRLSVHVYNMTLNQAYVAKMHTIRMRELELTGNSWPSTGDLTLTHHFLKKLSLADNQIETLYTVFLDGCPYLEVLDISRNKIFNYMALVVSVAQGQLNEINLAENSISRIAFDHYILSWPSKKKLNLSYNKISSVYLYNFPVNYELDLSFNSVTELANSLYSFRVDRMVLAGQNISSLSEVGTILTNFDREMFEYSIRNVEVVFDNDLRLQALYIPQSRCTLNKNYMQCKGSASMTFHSRHSGLVNLTGNAAKMHRESVFEIWPENLVDLSENNLKYLNDVPSHISDTKHLNLSRNSIGYINMRLFENMTLLTVVDLSYNQLKHVQLILYSSLFILDISNNCLNRTNISHSSLKYITEYLNLSHNSFTGILKGEWSQFRQFLKIDLGENSLQCCGPEGQHSRSMLVHFQDRILNINSSKALTCVRPYYGKVEMTDTWLSEEHCQFNVQGWTAFGCLLLLLPLIVHGVDLVDYFMHQTERDLAEQLTRLKKQGLEQDENCAMECKYDAFVCHSHKDAGWVTHELVPNLENVRDGHRLCIHYRDFQLGSFIEENVEKAMNASRKVIVVVTRSFIKSNWCKMELTFAWEKMVREGRNYIIVIEVDKFPKGKRPPILSYLMRSRTYLEWPEAPTDDVKQECWDRVRDAMGKSLRDRQQEQMESGTAALQMDCEDLDI